MCNEKRIYVGSVRSIKSVPPVRAERWNGLTFIALCVMASGQLNGIVDSFNYVAPSKLPVFSGGGSGGLYRLSSGVTCNLVAMLLYALKGRAAQQIVDDADIDGPALEAFFL